MNTIFLSILCLVFLLSVHLAFADSPTNILTFGGIGTADGEFKHSFSAVPDGTGKIYVTDYSNNRIQVFDSDGDHIFSFGSKGSGDGQFYHPVDLTFDSKGDIYVTDNGNSRVQKFTPEGVFISSFGSFGVNQGDLFAPYGITIDSDDNIYVSEYGDMRSSIHDGKRVQKFDSEGNHLLFFIQKDEGVTYNPHFVSLDSKNNLYVSNTYDNTIQKFDSQGNFILNFVTSDIGDNSFYYPVGITFDCKDNMYVTDLNVNKIHIFDDELNHILSFDGGDNSFNNLSGIKLSNSGDKIYITDKGNNRVSVFENPLYEEDSENTAFPPNPDTLIPYIVNPDDNVDDSTNDDTKKSGGGCNDCTPPTLGYDSDGVKKVDNGVCINDSCMDGGYFHTEYPMQHTTINSPNVISTTYYENGSPSNVSLVQLGIGVKEIGSTINDSQVLIEVYIDYFANDMENPTIKEIKIIDPDGIIHNATAAISLVPCMENSNTSCLKTDFEYSYGIVPTSTILMSNAIDHDNNTVNNYFNDGLAVADNTISDVPVLPEIDFVPLEPKCTTSSTQADRNNCQFKFIVSHEIKRAQAYLDSIK